MEKKTKEIQDMLMVLADRMGMLMLKLKASEGEEYDRLMKIAHAVRESLEELVDIEDQTTFEEKVKSAYNNSNSI